MAGDQLSEELVDYIFRQIDEDQSNHTIAEEHDFLMLIKYGDLDSMKKLLSNNIGVQYPLVIANNRKKNEEYMAIAAVTLATRAAIAGGLSCKESFDISDVILRQISEANTIEETMEARNQGIIRLVEQVQINMNLNSPNVAVEDSKEFIAAHITEKISLSNVATALHVDPSYLARIFKQNVGMTVGDYIKIRKIELAEKMLKFSDRTILEISEYLNYPTQSYFGKMFHDISGMSPGEFRKRFRLLNY